MLFFSMEDDESFDEDEASLLREMMDLPKNMGLRKVNNNNDNNRYYILHHCVCMSMSWS